mgnify:FL=1
MHVKKGMLVKIICGNHKDSEGKILNVFPKKQCVTIEGVNFRKRATRPTQDNPSGGFVEREAPIHISNVMLVHNGTPTKVGFKNLDDGSKVRISKKTNEEIEI